MYFREAISERAYPAPRAARMLHNTGILTKIESDGSSLFIHTLLIKKYISPTN